MSLYSIKNYLSARKCEIGAFFQALKRRAAVRKPMLIGTLLLAVLIPSHPLRGGNGHWVELADRVYESEAINLFKIYSVLRSYRMDLKDAEAWEISETILGESLKHALDPMLVLAVINVESHFQHTAISAMGARGLMQIRPFVAKALAQEVGIGIDSESNTLNPDSLDDPVVNIKLGVFYLQELQRNFKNVQVALTAYNWGPTKIRNKLANNQELPLGYAAKVLATYRGFRKNNPPIS
jgi:soluble lytic murein transglycosylase